MSDKKAKVSVIMPAYNAEKYIEAAISSVLNQTYKNIELIVIDDCSKDNTYARVQKLAESNSSIRLYKNKVNLGVADTRNRGFGLAEGRYVALLDSDDVWKSDKIESQLHEIEKYNADLVYCSYGFIDEKGNKIKKDFLVPDKADLSIMLKKNIVGCSTALLTNEIAKKYKFDKLFYHEDYVLWLQILKDGYKAVGCAEVLVDYRILENSRSSNKIKCAKERWKIYRRFMKISVIKSFYYWVIYVYEAIKKHKNFG